MPCVFCDIVEGTIPSDRVYEDDRCVVFNDISPAAPVHMLVVPKTHAQSLSEVEDESLLGHLLFVAAQQAKERGLQEGGYRVVINTGTDGGQTVDHLHLHVLGGRSLQWPPG